MCDNLTEADRIALHECGHALIAVANGYILNAVRIDGPPENPGKIDRTIPGNGTGDDPIWARKELAVFCAGYMAERLFFGQEKKEYINGHHEADRPMMDHCAVNTLGIKKDCSLIQGSRNPKNRSSLMPRHLWRRYIRAIEWKVYDDLIRVVEDEVRIQLELHKDSLCSCCRLLLEKRALTGQEFEAELRHPTRCPSPPNKVP